MSDNQNSGNIPSFKELNLPTSLVAALSAIGIESPTPIQAAAIPPAITGEDIIGIAQTGTGKTYAFGLPMIQRIGKQGGNGLIILPTRELALQVNDSLQAIGRKIGLRTAVLVGGEAIERQMSQLSKKPHIIIGTPGRIIDHIDRRSVNLSTVNVLVLDEADRMLDMGFLPQIEKVLLAVPEDRQTLLFSATMPVEIVRLTTKFLRTPARIEVARAGSAAEGVDQEIFIVRREQKTQLLEHILKEHTTSTIIFIRTKHGAKKLVQLIREMGNVAAEIHSDRSLAQRKEALAGFKSGKYRVLVATDIAARGIDVQDIGLVINYDLPENAEDYVHRIGRTGRAGKSGRAISFATPDQAKNVNAIERLIKKQITITKTPQGLPPARSLPPSRRRDDGRPQRAHNTHSREQGPRYPKRRNERTARQTEAPKERKPRPSYGTFGKPQDIKIDW